MSHRHKHVPRFLGDTGGFWVAISMEKQRSYSAVNSQVYQTKAVLGFVCGKDSRSLGGLLTS